MIGYTAALLATGFFDEDKTPEIAPPAERDRLEPEKPCIQTTGDPQQEKEIEK